LLLTMAVLQIKYLFLKGMTGAFGPFCHLVLKYSLITRGSTEKLLHVEIFQ
jgi:hypothetical protein